jgi:hypothetical protein
MRDKRVGEMFELICQYEQHRSPDFSLYDHIYNVLSAYDVDTDTEMNGEEANGEIDAGNCDMDSSKTEENDEVLIQAETTVSLSTPKQSQITDYFKANAN